MLQVSKADVASDPFPHVISDAILPPDLYARLRADYPSNDVFDTTVAQTGAAGSRTGRGRGFDIYRSEGAYDALIKNSTAWAEFDGYVNSRAFIDKYQELFGDYSQDLGLTIDMDASVYDRSFIEPREQLTEKPTLADKVGGVVHRMTSSFRQERKAELFTRLDIQRAMGGYAKLPHTDRPNRLCSLIIYFTDADSVGLEGGELLIYKHKEQKPQANYERHPAPANVDIVAKLRAKENLGVFFPCNNNSYHGVTAVTSNGVPRDFLYINISARVPTLWR